MCCDSPAIGSPPEPVSCTSHRTTAAAQALTPTGRTLAAVGPNPHGSATGGAAGRLLQAAPPAWNQQEHSSWVQGDNRCSLHASCNLHKGRCCTRAGSQHAAACCTVKLHIAVWAGMPRQQATPVWLQRSSMRAPFAAPPALGAAALGRVQQRALPPPSVQQQRVSAGQNFSLQPLCLFGQPAVQSNRCD